MDTSVSSDNVGDEIICNSIRQTLTGILEQAYITTVATHDSLGNTGKSLIKKSDVSIFMGTNALTGHFSLNRKDIWPLSITDLYSLKNKILLCGVGWRNYSKNNSLLQKQVYKLILNKELIHSVRDAYTADKLRELGIRNVINTSCPTLWDIDSEHTNKIPKSKSKQVVFTLTRHKPHSNDVIMIDILLNNYEKVFFWPQQIEDGVYLSSILDGQKLNQIVKVPPSLIAFDNLLDENEIDFIGTRLHGGIRAIQRCNRSIIIAIDNRAKEINNDTNLPTLDRELIPFNLTQLIQSKFETNIRLPSEDIKIWKNQLLNLKN